MERKTTETDGESHRTVVTVGDVRFGHDPFPVIAGPCAIESEEQIRAAAEAVLEVGGSMLRGNVSKLVVTSDDFAGLGRKGLEMLRRAGEEYGLPTVCQVIKTADVESVAEMVDMVEIHSGSMDDSELLRAVGRAGKPVLLRRGPNATIEDWLEAAELIMAEGNSDIVLVERGIKTLDGTGADSIDIGSVPAVKELSHLPVLVDPSHAAGGAAKVAPMALAAQGVGADGLILEVHPDPASALTNLSQQLDPGELSALMFRLGVNRMRAHIDLVDREIVRMLARRQEMSLEIGRVKSERGLDIFAPGREAELMAVIRKEAEIVGIRPEHVEELFRLVLAESRSIQQVIRE